jgi:hypothetical protein
MESLKVKEGTGLTSCLTVRLDNATKYINENGRFPKIIDSSEQFGIYRDYYNQDISKILLSDYVYDENFEFVEYVKEYNHGWQYKFPDEMNLEVLSKFSKIICSPSKYVLDKVNLYTNILEDRTVVLYRGNDKSFEIARTPYNAMEIMALDSNSNKFLVQTDEEEFYQYFKQRFPNTICFEDIPRINKNPDSYVMPNQDKSIFAFNFFASLLTISQAPKLIMTSGNTSHWATLFRGKSEGIYQYNGNLAKWKKF